jgi:hypothetical protein
MMAQSKTHRHSETAYVPHIDVLPIHIVLEQRDADNVLHNAQDDSAVWYTRSTTKYQITIDFMKDKGNKVLSIRTCLVRLETGNPLIDSRGSLTTPYMEFPGTWKRHVSVLFFLVIPI